MRIWKCRGRTSHPPHVSWKLPSRERLLNGPTSKQHCTTHISPLQISCVYCSRKYCLLQGQQVVGAFNCHLLHAVLPSVLSSPFSWMICRHLYIYRHFQELSLLVLPHLAWILASHRNKASTKHPACDPSGVTEVVASLTDFILKYWHSCLLQLSSSAPSPWEIKVEVSLGQKNKTQEGNVNSAHTGQPCKIKRLTFFSDGPSRHSAGGRGG